MKDEICISRTLLESIRDDLIELLEINRWRQNSSKANEMYLKQLKDEIKEINDLLNES